MNSESEEKNCIKLPESKVCIFCTILISSCEAFYTAGVKKLINPVSVFNLCFDPVEYFGFVSGPICRNHLIKTLCLNVWKSSAANSCSSFHSLNDCKH